MAGPDITRQAVHQIEVGRARPSPRILELIAERTGKPVPFFLPGPDAPIADPTQDAREVQWLCLDNRSEEAVQLAERLLQARPKPRTEAEIRFWLGRAHLQAGRPDDAIAQLQLARQISEKVSDPWMAVECMDWEAGALYLKEDPKALALAEEALRACRALEPRMPRTEARILEHLGSVHVRNQNVEAAITYYEEAVEAAGRVRDLARVARTYHGLSIAYRQRGHLERAAEFAHKAIGLYSIEQDQTLVGRAENELGLLLMQQGQLESAEKWFQSALGHFQDSRTERVRSHVLLSLAELYLIRGDGQAAEQFTEAGLELAERFDESLARATGYLLRARVFALRQEWQRSDAQFDTALALLAKLGLKERLAAAHAEYAQTFEQRGDDHGAAEHWRRAAQLALPRLSAQVTA